MSCTETRAQNMPTWEKHVELGPSDDKQVVDRVRLGKHGMTRQITTVFFLAVQR